MPYVYKELNSFVPNLLQVTPADEGEYTCQVSAYKPSDLTHRLAVRGEYYYSCQVSAYKPSDLTHRLAVRGEYYYTVPARCQPTSYLI